MTSLTRKAFFERAENLEESRHHSEQVPGWGLVHFRKPSNVQETVRTYALWEAREQGSKLNHRTYQLIDWIVDEAGQPLFTDTDAEKLDAMASADLAGLFAVISKLGGETEGNEQGGSIGTSESSDETPASNLSIASA